MHLKIRASGGKPDGDYATFEHIKPFCQGGSFRLDNIALAHERCNQLRGISPQRPMLPVEMIIAKQAFAA